LIEDYKAVIHAALAFQQAHPQKCLELGRLAEQIRGFGHVKALTIQASRQRQAVLIREISGMDLPTPTVAGYGKLLDGAWA